MHAASPRTTFAARPLAQLAASFACGVLAARFTNFSIIVSVAACAFVSTLAVVAFARRRYAVAAALVCASFVCAGATLAALERVGSPADGVRRLLEERRVEAGEPVELTGVVARAPEVAPDGYFVSLRVERIRHEDEETRAAGDVELFAPVRDSISYARYDALELRRGARVRVMTELERAEEFRNPGASGRTEFLEREGYDAAGVIKSPLLVERLDDERVFLPRVWLEEWRARLHERLTENFSLETAGVLQAAMLGNRHGLSRETAERFRDGGTFHVLVISGLHVSFVGGLALLFARRLTRRRLLQFAATALPLWAYAVAVGARASVLRAALMFTFVALAPVVRRRADTLNALGAAALALLAWRPEDLFDPSFQLTFLSVAGIALLGWSLLSRLEEVGAWRPTRETPHPPRAPRWFRALAESLYWSERAWRRDAARNVYDCRLFKTRAATTLGRWHLQRPLRYASAAVCVSASVQIVMLPALVIYFHRVSLASVLLNIYVGALMALASLGALAALAVSPFNHPAAHALAWSVERAAWLMTNGVVPFSRLGLAALRLPAYTGARALVYALYYAPLAALLVMLARWRPLEPEGERGEARRRRERRTTFARRTASAAFAALAFAVVAHPLSAPRADGRLRVDFLDVGQGDAALLTLPDGTTLLVDGGGRPRPRDSLTRQAARATAGARPQPDDYDEIDGARFERDARGIGDAVVSEYLWWRGFSRVDYLLATHAHADHISGLKDVARAFGPRAAFVARTPRKEIEYAEFASAMRLASVPVRLVARGDVLRFGAATIEVLYPPPAPRRSPGGGEADSRAPNATDANTGRDLRDGADAAADTGTLPSGNDDSVVLRVRYGERCFLLTGDIEQGGESALVAARDDLRCGVVKVAHHGSRTSSTPAFVAAVRPAFAVVSVGLDSPFGHPDPSVVERWRAAGAEVLQTGRRGTITFSTDGHDLRVETFVRE